METKLNVNAIPEGSISTMQIESVINPVSRAPCDIETAFIDLNNCAFTTFEFEEDADGIITGYLVQDADRIPLQVWLINRTMALCRGLLCRFRSIDGGQRITSKCIIDLQTNYLVENDLHLGNIVPTLKAYFDDFIIISNINGSNSLTFRKIKPEDDVLETDLFCFLSSWKFSSVSANRVRLHNFWLSSRSVYGSYYYKNYSPIVEFNMRDVTIDEEDIIINNVTLKYKHYFSTDIALPLVVHVKKMHINNADDLSSAHLKNDNGECSLTYCGSYNNITILSGKLPGEETSRDMYVINDLHSPKLYSNQELTEEITSVNTQIWFEIGIWFDGYFEDSFGNRGLLNEVLPYNAYDDHGILLRGCNNYIEYCNRSYGTHRIIGSFNNITAVQGVDIVGNYQNVE